MRSWRRLLKMMFVCVISLVSTLIFQSQASASKIGTYNLSGREAFGCSSYILTACGDLVTFGHTVTSTDVITGAFLATVDKFYMPLLGSDLSASERAALSSFVSAGGMLFIQQDHTGGGWWPIANTLLNEYGIGTTASIGSDTHFIVGTDPVTNTPNDLTGKTIGGCANSVFSSVNAGTTVFLREGSTSGNITGALRSFGSGLVVTTADIDMWSSCGYGGTNNPKLWQNIWNLQGGGGGGVSVPEPGTMWLFAAGLATLLVLQRRWLLLIS